MTKIKEKGFTLIEIMTVVVVFGVILSSVVALSADKTPREDLQAKARETVDIISRAHNYAVAGYQSSEWGVKILDDESTCALSGTEDCVIIYKGQSFAGRNAAYDEILRYNTGAYIEADQENEFYFKRISGWLASTTAITDQALVIKNNFNSQKTVTTTAAGLVYFTD